MVAEYGAVRARLERLTQELARVRATTRSADRSVTVTVGPRGELVDLRIDAGEAARVGYEALGQSILEASDRAVEQVGAELRTRMSEALPQRLRHLVGPAGTIDLQSVLSRLPAQRGGPS
jgi:DNA-binding protein YbaB